MRQLIVSDGTAVSYSGNVLAAGAVDIVKLSADGHTPLLPGETITDSDSIRIIQGTAEGVNIFTPWIPGADIVSWKGTSYTAQTRNSFTATVTTVPTAAGEVTIKVTDRSSSAQVFPRKSFTLPVTAGLAVATIGARLVAGLTGETAATILANQGTFYPILGSVQGEVQNTGAAIGFRGNLFSIASETELGNLTLSSEGMDGSNGTTLPITSIIYPSLGAGDGNIIIEYEKSLKGDRSFYNRIFLPNTPPTYAVAASTYDVYTLAFKNSVPGSINGVDNLREISIARVSGAAAAVISAFEGAINPYAASCPGGFAPVNL